MKKKEAARWWLILAICLGLFTLLAWRLYDLTVLQGPKFYQLSQSRRTKEIQIAAPRGNIYDRNGVLLAGTRTSFTLQGYKDAFQDLSGTDRWDTLSTLVPFLERDGVDYTEDFPMAVHRLVYRTDADYIQEQESPVAKAQRLLKENQLLAKWLAAVYQDPQSLYKASPAARALTAYSLKGSPLPISCDPDHNYALAFLPGESYQALLDGEEITEETRPLDFLAQKLSQNENILSHTLNHPASMQLAYQVLKEAGKTGNLVLADYVFAYQEDYRIKKAALSRSFPAITMESEAKDDFVAIVKRVALDRFLQSIAVDADNHFLIPAENVLNRLSGKGVDTNLRYTIAEDAQSVAIEYEEAEDTEEKPLDRLKKLALENDLLDPVILSDDYKKLAQDAIFAESVYPGISINDWTYASKKSHDDFIKGKKLEEKTPAQAFSILQEKDAIPQEADPCLSLGAMMIKNKIMQVGNYAFWPSNLCYELSEDTVAKIEENIPLSTGLLVSRQPIRYYPYGESACHVLGYIGKIASEAEISKYVDKAGYLPNELVGKTGVEESFEDTLHGVSGKEVVLVDSTGNRTETLERREPKAGNNIYLSIDIKLQKQAESSLKNSILAVKHGRTYVSPWGNSSTTYSPTANSAANIAIDPKTGELLSMASYPMFDPNLFVTGISASDWELYQTDKSMNPDAPKPLLNLVTQTAVQPGSTFKTIVSLSALEQGMDPGTIIDCRGFVQVGNRRFNCLIYTLTGGSHGPLNLADALGVSCNYYFYSLGLGKYPYNGQDIGVHVGVDELHSLLLKLGMDQPSGLEINQPSQAKNHIPSREGKVGLSQALLERYLRENLALYVKEGQSKNSRQLDADIKEIIAWSGEGESIGRSEMIHRLDSLGYQPETPLENQRAGLADILKYTYFNQINWTVADTMNTVIGQGQNAYTPISMCTVDMILANKGTKYKLTLIKEIRSSDNKTVLFKQEPKGKKIDIQEASFDAVREGMRRSAIHSGEGFAGLNFPVGSKTGTAQRGNIDPRTKTNYASYAWNMAFAPLDDPKIATVSFMPAGELSVNVTPISRDIIASYLQVPQVQEVPKSTYDGLKTYYPETEEPPFAEAAQASEAESEPSTQESKSPADLLRDHGFEE